MTRRHKIHHGMKLRAALQLAKKLCYRVDYIRGTGEVRVQSARNMPSLAVNVRNSEAPRALTGLLLKMARQPQKGG